MRNDPKERETLRNVRKSPTHRFPLSYMGIWAFGLVRMGLRG